MNKGAVALRNVAEKPGLCPGCRHTDVRTWAIESQPFERRSLRFENSNTELTACWMIPNGGQVE